MLGSLICHIPLSLLWGATPSSPRAHLQDAFRGEVEGGRGAARAVAPVDGALAVRVLQKAKGGGGMVRSWAQVAEIWPHRP